MNSGNVSATFVAALFQQLHVRACAARLSDLKRIRAGDGRLNRSNKSRVNRQRFLPQIAIHRVCRHQQLEICSGRDLDRPICLIDHDNCGLVFR
jgi:hypothetical protein